MNQLTIIGNLGGDPTFKDFGNGNSAANFNVAVSEKVKNKRGEIIKNTEWFRVVAWNQQAEFIQKHVKKGAKVFIQGKVRSRDYTDSNGNPQRVTELVSEKFEILNWANDEKLPNNREGIFPGIPKQGERNYY